MARPDRDRLDLPSLPARRLRPSYDPEAFGRMSETILGTGRFLVIQTCVVLAWVLWNAFMPAAVRFDPYPFIFLTLMLSLQAAYAAPLILLAQNRQDDRDRANLAQDRAEDARTRADTDYLAREVAALRIAVGEVVTRDFLRAELRELVEEVAEAQDQRLSGEPEARQRRKAQRRQQAGQAGESRE